MRLAMESTHTARFTSAAEKNTFRSRQVKASTSSPMGMALRTISRGWALKWASTVRRALGWHHRASSVMHPASSTAATSEPPTGAAGFWKNGPESSTLQSPFLKFKEYPPL